MPVTKTRVMLRSDLPEVLKIEAESFGDWIEGTFLEVLSEKDTIAYVAVEVEVNGPKFRITGFFVAEVNQFSLRVINMASITPEARSALIEKAHKKAQVVRRVLTWKE